MLTELPLGAAVIARVYDPSQVTDYAIFWTCFVFMMCPMINPILTLYVVRPIRKEFLRMIKSDTISVPVIQLHNNLC